MNFKEFLEEKEYRIFNSTLKTQPAVLTKDLGEWAWNNCYSIVEEYKEFFEEEPTVEKIEKTLETEDVPHNDIQIWDIAVSCLGEKEIKKRLKEMK